MSNRSLFLATVFLLSLFTELQGGGLALLKNIRQRGPLPLFFFLMWKTFIHRNLQPNKPRNPHVILLKENTLHWWTWQMYLMHWLLLYITSFNHSKWLFVRMFHLHSKTRMQASANNTSPCCQRWAFSQALTSVGMSLKDQFLWSFNGLYNPDQEGGRFLWKHIFSFKMCPAWLANGWIKKTMCPQKLWDWMLSILAAMHCHKHVNWSPEPYR